MNPRQNEPPKGGENGRSHDPTCKLSSFFVNANNYPHSHKLCSASTIIHLFPPLLNTESLRPHGNIFLELRISLFNALNSNFVKKDCKMLDNFASFKRFKRIGIVRRTAYTYILDQNPQILNIIAASHHLLLQTPRSFLLPAFGK